MKKLIKLLIIATLAISIIGCKKKEPVETEEETETVEESSEEPTVRHEGMARSYLTGKWVDEKIAKTRPVAVMLNNIYQAIPQSDITSAEVVYEAPVEGGLTRLMGIFEDYSNLQKIGSVRSCRTYYVYYMLEFNAMYVHCGQAAYALDVLGLDIVNNMSSLRAEGNTVFYKTTDRVAPHNTYTSGDRILAGAEQLGYKTTYSDDYHGHYIFNEDDEKEINLDNGTAANIVKPGYVSNKPWFEYHPEDGLYYRYEYDEKQVDEQTNAQLAYKNIIMQYSNVSNYDDTAYLNIDTNSGGNGLFITNGKAIDITWKKDSTYGVTHYFDKNGKEIILNQGKTWVCIIDNNATKKVEVLDSTDLTDKK